ncbi:MAG: hypothetical protein R3A46_07140 [Thermomicrobiales bacterium]
MTIMPSGRQFPPTDVAFLRSTGPTIGDALRRARQGARLPGSPDELDVPLLSGVVILDSRGQCLPSPRVREGTAVPVSSSRLRVADRYGSKSPKAGMMTRWSS